MRLLSKEGCDAVFDEQYKGRDLVLTMPARFGMGYGLSTEMVPIGPRACYWGGYGGSIVVMDQDVGLTVCYVMNKMAAGVEVDLRGANVMLAAAGAAVGA